MFKLEPELHRVGDNKHSVSVSGFVQQDLAVCSCKIFSSLSMDSLDLLPSKGHSTNYSVSRNINQVFHLKTMLRSFPYLEKCLSSRK